MKDDKANAAIEAGFLFPVLVSILLGVVDIGNGLIVNQKTINSCQTIGDLLAREDDVNNTEFLQAVAAGQLSFSPYTTATMGYDVAGVQFLGISKTPTVIWRETFNMNPNPNATVTSDGLGQQNEGVLAVTVVFTYTPFFSNFVVGTINMQEEAYVRGRKGYFVTRSNT